MTTKLSFVDVELALTTCYYVLLGMANKNDNACINLSKDVRAQLKSLGSKGETYDSVIRNLIEKKSCPENQESQNGDEK